ncbi:MAG: hypothetical protein JWQ04_1327 [Pedosphaera sp.]|nr:hypothetical protein [Pedosphaera sp.]
MLHTASTADGYEKAVEELEKCKGSTISVPELSQLLGVKTTTINARFRREGTQVITIGRTNYIRGELALPLVDLHKYALKGWPTLQEVSRLTAIKTGTLKARCEKGKLEAFVDLTKRLRLNPDEVATLSLGRSRSATQPDQRPSRARSPLPFSGEPARRASGPKSSLAPLNGISPARKPFVLPPAPEPRVQIITANDYGFAARNNSETGTAAAENKPASHVEKKRGSLNYNPERPLSIAECSVGKTIRYEQYDGTITKLINDPFNPAIKVALPNHVEPLMREILLRVGK